MKSIELSTSKQSLSECAQELNKEVVVLTLYDEPVAAIVPLEPIDAESWKLSNNPEFLAIIEHSRAEYLAGRKLTFEEMKREIAAM